MKKTTFFEKLRTLIFLFGVCFSANYSYAQKIETFSTNGSYTWICPANVTQVKVQCWGAGGGGGNSGNGTTNGGHGGGGGAFSEDLLNVVYGKTYYIQIGKGGNGALAYSLGSAYDGTDSWFNNSNNAPTSNQGVLAKAGRKGYNNSNQNFSNGGESILGFGNIKYSGGNGLGGTSEYGQGGGSSAGFFSNGTSASSYNGATPPVGGGIGGPGSYMTSIHAISGGSPGGGGGGSDDSPGSKGGDGADGKVIMTYYHNCTGITNIPQVSASSTSGCGQSTFYATNNSSGLGISYQWQRSLDNLSWSNLFSQNDTIMSINSTSDSYYRLRTDCVSGDTKYSNSIFYDYTINPADPAPLIPKLNIECGQSVKISPDGGGGIGYLWFSDSLMKNQINNSLSYTTSPLSNDTMIYVASYDNAPEKQIVNLIKNESNLINLPNKCGNGSVFGSGIVGFNWLDNLPLGVNIKSILLQISTGIECNSDTRTTTLNGLTQKSFSTTLNCSCIGNSNYSLNLNPADYKIGKQNEFKITSANNFGLTKNNSSLDSSFAKIIITYASISPCVSSIVPVPIKLTSSKSAGTISSSQTICFNTRADALSFQGLKGVIQWQKSLDSLSWVNITGSNRDQLSSSEIGFLTKTTFFRIILSNFKCTDIFSNVVKIKVLPLPIVEAGPNQYICAGKSATVKAKGANNYKWSNGVLDSIPFTVLNDLTLTVEGKDSSGCVNTDQLTITSISPNLGGIASTSQSICSGSKPNNLNLTSYSGSIQWQTSNDSLIWSDLNNANASTLSFSQMESFYSTKYFRAKLSNSVCQDAYSNIVKINVFQPSIPGSISSAQTICNNTYPNALILIGNIGSIQWQYSADNINWSNISGANETTLSGDQMGKLLASRYYRATVTSGNCPQSITNTIVITINPNPTGGIVINGNQKICQGEIPVDISLTEYNGSIQWQLSRDNYNWENINESNNYTLTSKEIGPLINTTYFRPKVISGLCSQVITITVMPVPSVDAGNDVIICKGSSIKLSGSGAKTYSWDNEITNNVSFTPLKSQKYTLLGKAENGCSNTDSINVTVVPLPTSEILTSGNLRLCQDQSMVMTASSDNGQIYQWFLNDSIIISETNKNLHAKQQGNYSVLITNSSNCSSISKSIYLSVIPSPIVSAGYDQTICVNDTITLTAFSTINYSWDHGVIDGQPFQPDSTTTYKVTTIEVDGCKGSDEVTIFVNYPSSSEIFISSLGDLYFNGAWFTKSGTYTQRILNVAGCDSLITLHLNYYVNGIQELSSLGISLFPNPSPNGIFKIKKNDEVNITDFRVFDSNGKIVISTKFDHYIDLSNFISGSYYLELIIDDKKYYTSLIKN